MPLSAPSTSTAAIVGTTEDTQGYTYPTTRQELRGTVTTTSGYFYVYGFTAGASRTISKLGASVGATAAAGITTFRMGIYTCAADGSITLVASTPNTTASLSGTYTPYQIGLSASYALVAGTRYMVGLIIVATTMPVLNAAAGSDDYGNNSFVSGVQYRLVGYAASQTDLPATMTNAALTTSGNSPHVLMII